MRSAIVSVVLGLLIAGGGAAAREAVPASADPALEQHVLRIAAELRCLVCQNQSLADSHAPLALDLRQQIREMLRRGDSDAQVRAFMTERYGDFVLYRPPVRPGTWLLWFGPALLLAGGLATLAAVLRRRARLADDRFEPDPEEGAMT